MAQLVRAPPCHGGGHGFESRLGRISIENGILAQLGEHLPYKQRVIGSSPIGPICAGVAELADAQDLKSCETYLSYRFDPGRRHSVDFSEHFDALFLLLANICYDIII